MAARISAIKLSLPVAHRIERHDVAVFAPLWPGSFSNIKTILEGADTICEEVGTQTNARTSHYANAMRGLLGASSVVEDTAQRKELPRRAGWHQ
ncbi:hypothetical protein EVAR_90661_1 [Eumeta japonica]|uniref:Uncharacterized protein n=1 Tax=Eumeta variegata TaxID=151549 RepID=A0A4C1ZC17_EUMVA|nr:hypothetical protein EVAR_90661_1 [Eumeta japonica]